MKERIERVKALRKAYKSNGYIPVAVHNAVVGDKKTGKNPIGTEWQKQDANSPITADAKALNTGILLSDLYAIDQDTDDKELSEAVERLIVRHFGSMPLKRFRAGSHRFLTLFRSEGGITKQKIGKSGAPRYLEVLSKGQQFVADGTHWTGAIIDWVDGISPANVHKDELPLVTGTQMTAFLLDVKKLFGTPDAEVAIHGFATGNKTSKSSRSHETMSIEDLAALLDDLNNADEDYDDWLHTLAAIYATDNTHEGLTLAHAWSAKSTKYDRKIVDQKWRSFEKSPLTKIKTGTLLHKIRAQIPGWISPSIKEKTMAPQYPERWSAKGRTVGDEKVFDKNVDINRVIKEYNEKYAVVPDGGAVEVVSMQYNDDLGRYIPTGLSIPAFKQLHSNDFVWVEKIDESGEVKTVKRRKPDIWLDHPARRTCQDGFGLNPEGTRPSVYNLWQGFGVAPRPGRWPMLRELIFDCIAAGDPESFDYIMLWMANLVQFPARSPQTCLVFRGEQGTGKGTLGAKVLMKIMGHHGKQITQPKHLVGAFNAHLRDVLFLFADEAFFAGDKASEGVLKGLVTEDYRINEAKGKDAVLGRNRMHLMMASNHDWVVPASADARRFAVFDVSTVHKQDIAFFEKVYAEIEDGGVEALMYDLMQIHVDKKKLLDVPKNTALAKQKLLSIQGPAKWLLDVLHRGYVINGFEWSEEVSTEDLMRSYREWSAAQRERYPASEVELGKVLSSLFPSKRLTQNGRRPRGYVLGTLTNAMEKFAKTYGIIDAIEFAHDDEDVPEPSLAEQFVKKILNPGAPVLDEADDENRPETQEDREIYERLKHRSERIQQLSSMV